MHSYDVYSLAKAPDGKHIILKNGDFMLECTGTIKDAENIVRLLNADVEKARKEKQT